MKPSKVGDFFLGLAGCVAVNILLGLVASSVITGLARTDSPTSSLSGGLAVLSLIVNLALLGASLAFRRPFIALGYVAAFIIPALLFGACLLVMGGFR